MRETIMFQNQHEKRGGGGGVLSSITSNQPIQHLRWWVLGSSSTLAAEGLATSAPDVHKPVLLSQTV